LRPPKAPAIASAVIAATLLASLLILVLEEGFPAFRLGQPSTLVPSAEVNEALIHLIWEERLPDLMVQAALVVLAAAVCISAVRLWRGEW